MTSALTPRDPVNDHLLTPQNCALLVIDYQPIQVTSVASRDRSELVINIVAVARIAKLYKLASGRALHCKCQDRHQSADDHSSHGHPAG